MVNLLPYWGVHWAGRLVRNTGLKGSARLLAGLVLFPVTWVVIGLLLPWDGWLPWAAVLVGSPALGLVAVGALERVVALRRAWRGWISLFERAADLEQVRDDRARLVELVVATDPASD